MDAIERTERDLERSFEHIENAYNVTLLDQAMYRVQRANVEALLAVAEQLKRQADIQREWIRKREGANR